MAEKDDRAKQSFSHVGLLRTDVRRVLTLFAGFTIGMHIAVFLHELGHALGYSLKGGRVTAIVMLSPLPAGYVNGFVDDPFLYVWGGVASVPRYLALMTAAFCLGHNALYLVVGGIVPYADAEGMIALGAPRWLLVLLGMPLMVGFILVLSLAIQPVGLRPAEPVWRWIVIVEAGLLTTPALMVLGLGFDPSARSILPAMLVLVSGLAMCFAVAACRARSAARASPTDFESLFIPERWSTTLALLAGAVLLIAVEWLTLRPA
jgi:hypothetical protein